MTGISLAPDLAPPRGAVRPLAAAALLAGVLGWGLLFHAEIAAAVRVWIASTAYNHGFFILPIALWLAWDRRRAAAGLRPVPAAWPALLVLPLGLVWFAADRLGVMEARQLAALAMLEALLLAWLGWRLARVFAAALVYLVFLVPFGAFVTPALQVFTARFIDTGLDLLGIPHVVTAFIIEIPEGTFFVAEACAGLRFLIAAIAFGALYALLIYRSPGRRLGFLAVSCVVPVIANGLRALGIVVLGHILGSAKAAVADHVIYGWGFFSLVILLLTLAGLPFREDDAPPAPPAAAPVPPAIPRTEAAAWVAVAAALLLAAIGPAAAALLDRRATGAVPSAALPGFAAAASCRAAGDAPGAVFDCAGMTLTARVLALPPGSAPAALQAALLAATGERNAEDVVRSTFIAAAQRWRLTELAEPPRLTATAAFIDGAPRRGGWEARLRLAWNSVAGGGGAPVLAAATLALPAPAGPALREKARQVLRDFLAAQGATLAAAAGASAAPR